MRLRPHNRVALVTGAIGKGTLLSPCYRLERRTQAGHKLVTEGALCLRGPGGVRVPDPEGRGVVEGPLGQSVVARLAARGDLRVADRTVADAILVARPPGLVAHGAIPHRRDVQLRDRSLLRDVRMTGFACDSCVADICKVLRMRELEISAVHRIAGRGRHVGFASNLGGVGIDYETPKLVIIRILLLD